MEGQEQNQTKGKERKEEAGGPLNSLTGAKKMAAVAVPLDGMGFKEGIFA